MITSMYGGYSSHSFFFQYEANHLCYNPHLGLVPIWVWNINHVFMIFVNQLFTPCFCKLKFLIKRIIKKIGCLCVQSLFQIIGKILLGYSSKQEQRSPPAETWELCTELYGMEKNNLAEAWLLTREWSGLSEEKEIRQGREGAPLNQTSAAIRASLVMVTDWRLCFWKVQVQHGFHVSIWLHPWLRCH